MAERLISHLDPQHPKQHLDSLHTPFGVRSLYDSVSFCTRCGSCQQSCPTYLLTAQEMYSPRGRNQALRLVIEGKLNVKQNRKQLEALTSSCLLCGRCTQTCAGKIPTAEHMLELRRALHIQILPSLLYRLLHLRSRKPKLFHFLLQSGLIIRRAGIISLLRLLGITRLKSLAWLAHADDILPHRPDPASKKLLRESAIHIPDNPQAVYLPSLEAQWFMPELGADVFSLAAQKYRVWVWGNTSSGLFEYIYGDLRQSRRIIRRLIRRHEQKRGKPLPVLTDSVDIYLFLRQSPQLFEKWPWLKEKAHRFADSIRFVTDFFPKTTAHNTTDGKVQLEYSSLFQREGEPFESARKILKTQFKKNFVECLYKDADAPAFGYSFVQPKMAEQIAIQAVQRIARTQSKAVFTLSGLSALELNYYLKRFYPYAQADHIARFKRVNLCNHSRRKTDGSRQKKS